jgi:CBS domain-containing protein
MGMLLPGHGNATYSGAGILSPLCNDPGYRTIGVGTRIFLGGGIGYVIGEGTQHSPGTGFGTLMVKGELRGMSPDYLRGATFTDYGTSLYVGIGVPIPVLDEEIAAAAGISDKDIKCPVFDYGVARLNRPKLREASYAELKSGSIEIAGKDVATSSMSSFYNARIIAEELKKRIKGGKFLLTSPVEQLPREREFVPMRQTHEHPPVRDVMTRKVVTIEVGFGVKDAAETIQKYGVTHLPVVDAGGKLVGIVTAWDISRAVAESIGSKLELFMTRDVVTVGPDDPLELAAGFMEQNNVSALPVVDSEYRVVGLVSGSDLARFLKEGGK